MFREMRLGKQVIEKEEIEEILNNATNGILAVSGDDDYPYSVPVSFLYADNKIYFHSTTEKSHKMDAIAKNPKVSFCVVSKDEIDAEGLTSIYKSVIAFGKAKILTEKSEIMSAIMKITQKYASEFMEKGKNHAEKYMGKYCVIEIDIEHLTGKYGF